MIRVLSALLLLAWAGPSAARADSDPLVPSYAEAQARAAQQTARKLEQTLRRLPNVSDARVHIAPSDLSHVPLDQPAPAPRISAWLALTGPGPEDATLRKLLSAGAAGVNGSAIEIVRQQVARTASAPLPLAAVGPFRVAAESAPWLRAVLGALLATNVILATVIMWRRKSSR